VGPLNITSRPAPPVSLCHDTLERAIARHLDDDFLSFLEQ